MGWNVLITLRVMQFITRSVISTVAIMPPGVSRSGVTCLASK